ncbi:MAG: Gfo/Idh/MocA family oxidoreductase [Candidatus Omnitrophica bacterium]|nr:Gfo/Idh/MocA family oxidoreductase [Candidatus Omnitrophota bacterium]
MSVKKIVNTAVIGVGNWGKNLVRNFAELSNSNLIACCDLDEKKLEKIKKSFPKVSVTKNVNDVLRDPEIDAIIVATSASTHFKMAKKCLLSGKHVFVEKPLCLHVKDVNELNKIAKEKNKKIMVGHLLEYHPAVNYLKDFIKSGKLGDIYYIYSQRVNLGKIRDDENALWSLAPHDISVILYLLNEEPVSVAARGEYYLQKDLEDVVFLNLQFKDKKMANIHLSWLDPHKIRKITVVGNKKMVVFDDMEATEKIKIYDKGADPKGKYVSYEESITLRNGDILIPSFTLKEPLKLECQHFLDCIIKNKKPLSDGYDGLRVVRVLEAARKSLKKNGVPVRL